MNKVSRKLNELDWDDFGDEKNKKLKIEQAYLDCFIDDLEEENNKICNTNDSKKKAKSNVKTNQTDNLNENTDRKIVSKENAQMPTFLFNVIDVKINEIDNSIQLGLDKFDNLAEPAVCILSDSWTSTNVKVNDIVHVLADLDSDGLYQISDTKGYIIVNPHHILSGTNILSSLFCLRKSVLNNKFKDVGATSSHMVLGNFLHILFQHAIMNKKYDKVQLNSLIMDLLKRKQIISQLYDSNLDEEFVLKETSIYLASIEKWLQENVNHDKITKSLTKNFQIQDVCDIEESIWSPKYGIKGKLDLTLKSEIKLSAYKNLSNMLKKENINQTQTHVIPVELKSGRTTFSAEHEGQVMLYSLLNSEKRKTSDFGLLLYLKDMNMKFIKVNHNSLKGLIQLRNELVYYISANELPEFKNEDRICSKCSMLTVCSLLGNDKITETDSDAYKNAIKHLEENHIKYFFDWYKMLELEFQDFKQFEAGETIWWKSQEELENIGLSVFNLKIESDLKKEFLKSADNYSGEGFFSFDFKKCDNSGLGKNLHLKENDMILLTSLTDNLVGISQGFIKSISQNGTYFSLLLDKNLRGSYTNYGKDHLFRIDKINFRSAINLNYTNLARLIGAEEKCARLRSFIIDKNTPKFDKTLPKQDIIKNKNIFKKLNQSQQSAIIRALMAHDYLLIKGYPGTGKTTTIASLIAILTKLEKKVLFTSFTNSAVDNLLLKVLNDYSIDFVRIGSYDRIHPEIQKFEAGQATLNLKSVQEVDEFYKQKQLIATTCSSIGHSIFNKIEFDYCIVDEASQVLLTTCLGPLFASKKFILVGDLEQLPPIIKNKDARSMGMGVSLFEWLDCKEGSIELVHQYRMNKEIMNLANQITYQGKLECLSEKTANSTVSFINDYLNMIKSDELLKILNSSVIFIDTSEIMKSVTTNKLDKNENRTVNQTECEIVSSLCNVFYKKSDCNCADDIGIIAPYNNQVREIQSKFSNRKFFQNIEVNTVDQFQGRDKKVIIMTFTNAIIKEEDTKELEILNDKRRLTVAITRAKQKLIMIGCVQNLVRYKPLANLISVMKEKNQIISPSCLEELNFQL